MERVDMLKQAVAGNPEDPFARYGLAMEYSSAGETELALGEFATLLRKSPDYTAGYFMAAQTLERAGRTGEARKMLHDGIACATRTRNSHAQAEMEDMLSALGPG